MKKVLTSTSISISKNKDFKNFLVKNELDEKFKSFTTLTEHQKEIFIPLVKQIDNIIKTDMVWDNIISLSGSAGVGKTFITSKIIELMGMLDYSITLTAPTHKAVKVASDMMSKEGVESISTSIQSFLNLKQEKCYYTGKVKFTPDRKKEITKTDILIVDESSMVGADIYEYITQAREM